MDSVNGRRRCGRAVERANGRTERGCIVSTARRLAKPLRTMVVKLHNRRVCGGILADGSIKWIFTRLDQDGGVRRERIRLSVEALQAMCAIATALTMRGPNARLDRQEEAK